MKWGLNVAEKLQFKCSKCKMESREYESTADLIEAKKNHRDYCETLKQMSKDYEEYCGN